MLGIALAWSAMCHLASGASITWNNTSTNFNLGSSWTGGTAPVAVDTAFFSLSGTTNASAGALPNIGTSSTLQQLRFSASAATGYTLSASAGQSLVLTSAGSGTAIGTGAALVSVIGSGTNTISAPIILGVAAGGTQAFTQTGNGTLLITGNVTESGTGTKLLLSGPTNPSIALRLSGTTTVTGGVDITAGSVSFTGPNAISGGVKLSGTSNLLLSTTAATLGAASNVITNVSGSNTIYLTTANTTLPNPIVVGENSYLRIWSGAPGGVTTPTYATGTITINAGGVLKTDKGSGSGYTFLGNSGTSPVIFGANSGTATALLLHGYQSGDRTNFGGLQTSTVVGDGPRITSSGTTGADILDLRVTVASGTSYSFNGSIQDNVLAVAKFTKYGDGTQSLGGNNAYTGTTSITASVLRLNSAGALPGGMDATGGTSNLTLAGGVVGLGNGDFLRATGTTADAVLISTGGGFAAYTADRVVNLGGAAATLTWGTNSFMTTASGTFVLGATDADKTVDFQNPLVLVSTATSASRTIRVNRGSAEVDAILSGVLSQSSGTASLVKVGGGVLSLTANNSFLGKLQITDGAVQVASINNSGNGPLGANTTTDLGSGATSGTLRWVGTTPTTTSRTFNLSGSTGGGGIVADGAALTISSSVTADSGLKTFVLGGTGGSTAAPNTIGTITGTGVSVVKDGTGLWRMNAASKGFGGTLTVKNGTLQVANAGVVGNAVTIGDTAPGASGLSALLLEESVNPYSLDVITTTGTQAALFGGANTSGTVTVTSGQLQMSRATTLVAKTGGTVDYRGTLAGATTGSPADQNVTIGAAGYAGRFLLKSSGTLATSGSVAVQYGTAVLGLTTTVSATGTLTTDSGATLAGTGFVTNAIGGAGLVSPGNSPGILTAGSLDPSAGTDFLFEITGAAPDFTNRAASINDVLRLTDSISPFASSLGAGNVVNVLFNLSSGTAPVTAGTYTGGFFTDLNTNFSASISSGSFAYWVLGAYGSGSSQQQFAVGPEGSLVTYSRLEAFDSSLSVQPSVVPQTGTVTGQITQFVVVPEPSTLALMGIGIGMAAWNIRRRYRA
jgi:autotransporter-associated beta strand protein